MSLASIKNMSKRKDLKSKVHRMNNGQKEQAMEPAPKNQIQMVFTCVLPSRYPEFVSYYKSLSTDNTKGEFTGEVAGLTADLVQEKWQDYSAESLAFENLLLLIVRSGQIPIPGKTNLILKDKRYQIHSEDYEYIEESMVVKRCYYLMDY